MKFKVGDILFRNSLFGFTFTPKVLAIGDGLYRVKFRDGSGGWKDSRYYDTNYVIAPNLVKILWGLS